MKFSSILLIITLSVPRTFLAQGVSVNTTNNPADPSAMLDVSSTSKGFLMPNMTTAQRDAIVSPAEGLHIFNLTTGCQNYMYNGAWRELCGACTPQPSVAAAGPDQINVPATSTPLAGNAPIYGTGQWTIISGNGGSFADDGDATTTFSGLAGNSYTLRWTISTPCGSTMDEVTISFIVPFTCGVNTVSDIDGNVYNTVSVNGQCWTKQNLKVTKNPQGGAINRRCYANTGSNCTTYGGLYDWNTAMNGSTNQNAQGICPDGWHIPSNADWTALNNFVQPQNLCVLAVESGCNDDFGLSILKGGYYYGPTAQYIQGFTRAHFWSSSQYDATTAQEKWTDTPNKHFLPDYANREKTSAMSIRCIKD